MILAKGIFGWKVKFKASFFFQGEMYLEHIYIYAYIHMYISRIVHHKEEWLYEKLDLWLQTCHALEMGESFLYSKLTLFHAT
jgi:hypothetical protein